MLKTKMDYEIDDDRRLLNLKLVKTIDVDDSRVSNGCINITTELKPGPYNELIVSTWSQLGYSDYYNHVEDEHDDVIQLLKKFGTVHSYTTQEYNT